MHRIDITDRHQGDDDAASTVVSARRPGRDRPLVRAEVSGDPAAWSLDYGVEPDEEGVESTAAREVLAAAVGVVAERGGGPLTLWVPGPGPEQVRMAASAGLVGGRVLYEMRRPLPVDEASRKGAGALATRSFRPGEDEEAWLAVNNRAFAWHPEQGGWTLETLLAREAEEWFDPEGFLLHETDGIVDGFCWTQVHGDEDPAVGEIYVIAADPLAAGGGFGRRLVLAGLDHLAAAGIEVGMLYTDADNIRAVKLYVDLGFVVHSLHQAFTGTIDAARGTSPDMNEP